MEQTAEEAHRALFLAVLGALVPDEARILSALSDGTPYALLHIDAGPRLGSPTRRVLANLSNVGKASGVVCPELTPVYVGRLCHLGLAESGGEDESFEVKYDILAAEEVARAAVERIRKVDRQRETLLRRTLLISPLGAALWAAFETEQP
jgi:hypothetical protein